MSAVETAELIKALVDPAAYPHRPRMVELVQTQMSLVFMTGEFVYKVKKPVNLGYLDYTTLAQRRVLCERELALNRRLCPETYVGLAPITLKAGKLVVEGEGEVVEYAVKMRQLPRERMMDALLPKGRVTADMVRRVAARMAEFHRQAETSPSISAFGSLEAIRINNEENFSQTEKYVGPVITPEQHETLKAWTLSFMAAQAVLFQKRVRGGRIRDCHGDLHAAHICFTNGICIYDCIEFNDRFRYCDVASEIAFLAMDIDFLQRPDLSKAFTDAYIELSGDEEIAQLLDFYKAYRACVRGKVECFKSEDRLISEVDREKAVQRAKAYFSLAASYIASSGGVTPLSPMRSARRNLRGGEIGRRGVASPEGQRHRSAKARPRLFITVGLVGAGKTVLAEALSRELGLKVISSDVVRKRLASVPLAEHHYDEFNKGLYSTESTRRTYDALFEEAGKLLARGKSVVLDASFRKAEERHRAEQLAESCGAEFWTIEVTCPEDVVRQRLQQRMQRADVPSDGRWEIYLSQRQDFDPVGPGPRSLNVDSSQPLDQLIREIVRKVTARQRTGFSRKVR